MAGFLALDELFEGRHFDREVIVLCVRWYLRFKLSYRDLVEMMAERGLSLVHTTIMRWGVSSEWGYDDTGGTVGRVDSRPGERGCDGCCG